MQPINSLHVFRDPEPATPGQIIFDRLNCLFPQSKFLPPSFGECIGIEFKELASYFWVIALSPVMGIISIVRSFIIIPGGTLPFWFGIIQETDSGCIANQQIGG